MIVYETQLENLCDQVMQEKDQEKLTKLMDQIFQLLAENQESAGEVFSPHLCCTDLTK
jgi:hypothetical protein